MYNEYLPVQTHMTDERRIIGRPFGRPWGYERPWGFGRPWGWGGGFGPFLGGVAGGLLGSALLGPYVYGFGSPFYGYGYPYFW